MTELLEQFVAEARELLEQVGNILLVIERTPDDEDAVNCLFRSVHTLKGSSGLFEVLPLTRVLHAAEDIFQAVREHRLAVTSDMVDLALKTTDQVGRWIEDLGQHGALPCDAGPLAQTLVAELQSRFGQGVAAAVQKVESNARADPVVTAPDLDLWFTKGTLAAAAAIVTDGGVIRLVSYLPEEGCFFRGEDPLHLALQIPQLEALEITARTPWTTASFDPFACNLSFHALTTAGRAELDALFRYVPEQATITELAASALDGSEVAAAPSHGLPQMVLDLLEDQIAFLAMATTPEDFAGRVGAASQVTVNALNFADRADAAAFVAAACVEALAAGRADDLSAAIRGVISAEIPAAVVLDISVSASQTEQLIVGETSERGLPRTLRVDQEKVDALMNLVGELVVAKNSLPFLARRAEQQFGLRELGREIKDQHSVIDRIAQELQSAIMSVRMMPVGLVFQRLPRLVRDLSRKLGKQVELVIEGEDTEADKNVIESLFDPLLHMVRNSLDHGVEPPDERAACGKPTTAIVKLLARHEGDQVVIEVVDDGRGIDPQIIKSKAHERGLIDDQRLATITDAEATMLVFAAGFSTASTVTDVSGRGVGMDVVRNAVENAGGQIAMTSVKGVGTTVQINLPLSMAVSRVMTVSVDDRLFGIPMNLIHGTVKVPRAEIARIKGAEAFVLRDQVVPLIYLARILGLPDCPAPPEEISVLVVRVGGQTIGLGLSAFGEGMEVILKPLEGILAKISGYAGTALLGNGRVLLVLDLKELIP